jgi:hypothetical protein
MSEKYLQRSKVCGPITGHTEAICILVVSRPESRTTRNFALN